MNSELFVADLALPEDQLPEPEDVPRLLDLNNEDPPGELGDDFDSLDDMDTVTQEPADKLSSLRTIMLSSKMNNTQQDALLHWLKMQYPLDNYPASYKTLFEIPRTPIEPIVMSPGQYHHFGIVIGLQSYCPSVFLGKSNVLIDVGIDGFTISKSSKLCG